MIFDHGFLSAEVLFGYGPSYYLFLINFTKILLLNMICFFHYMHWYVLILHNFLITSVFVYLVFYQNSSLISCVDIRQYSCFIFLLNVLSY